eukprot:m.399263 g.399263  ORF g.399263 m.399263 type:complete len:615 (-) comp21145_c0_seq1:71-1915(-)
METHSSALRWQGILRILVVEDLKDILKELGYVRSGRRAVLVSRILDAISGEDGRGRQRQSHDAVSRAIVKKCPSMKLPAFDGGSVPGSRPSAGNVGKVQDRRVSLFVKTPYFTDVHVVGTSEKLVTPMWEQPATYHFKIPPALVTKLHGGYKIFLRCGYLKNGPAGGTYEDKFPKATKWYCNNHVVREANHHRYRPIDISEHVKGSDSKTVKKFSVLTYVAPGNSLDSFCVYVMVAQEVSAQKLLAPLRSTAPDRDACKQWVLRQLSGTSGDVEVSVGKEFIPLICPLSQTRMTLPCRGDQCKHVQCFDAEYYVMCNSRRTSFLCPICSKRVLLPNLRRDTWLQDIISKTDAEMVEIELDVDGTWVGKTADDTVARKTPARRSDLGERRRKRQREEQAQSERTKNLGIAGSRAVQATGVMRCASVTGGGARREGGSVSGADLSSFMGLIPSLFGPAGTARSAHGPARMSAATEHDMWGSEDATDSSPDDFLRGCDHGSRMHDYNDGIRNPFSSDIAHLMGALAHAESGSVPARSAHGDTGINHPCFASTGIGTGVVPTGSESVDVSSMGHNLFADCERDMWSDLCQFDSSGTGMGGGAAASNPIFVVDSDEEGL